MRFLKGLAALTMLLAGVLVVPVLLWQHGRLGAFTQLNFPGVLTTPDDGTLLLGLLTAIGWVLWGLFTISVVAELLALLSRQRIRIRLPGLGKPQSLIAGLLIAVVAMVSVPLSAHAEGLAGPPVSVSAPHQNHQEANDNSTVGTNELADVAGVADGADAEQKDGAAAGATKSATAHQSDPANSVRHRVQRGDDLWSLAEKYYGDGMRWSDIHRANSTLISEPDQIDVGWNLLIPEVASNPQGVEGAVAGPAGSVTGSVQAPDAADPGVAEPGTAETSGAEPSGAEPSGAEPSHAGPKANDPSGNDPEVQDGRAAGPAAPEPTVTRPAGPIPGAPDLPAEGPRVEQPSAPGGGSGQPPAGPGQGASQERDALAELALVGSVGAFLAAGVVGTLAARRRAQLALRPVGRRIPVAPQPAMAVESALGSKQDPFGLAVLDLAMREIGRTSRAAGTLLPVLDKVTVHPDEIVFHWANEAAAAPAGFVDGERSWRLHRQHSGWLRQVPDLVNQPCPYPTLVCVGHQGDGTAVLIELERQLTGLDGEVGGVTDFLNALLIELSCAPWHTEVSVAAIGLDEDFIGATDLPEVRRATDLDGELSRLEVRMVAQRNALDGTQAAPDSVRLDPQTAPDWAPEVLLLDEEITEHQQRRLARLAQDAPALAIVSTEAVAGAPTRTFTVTKDLLTLPDGGQLRPQSVGPQARAALTQLMATTASSQTTPAPWWNHQPEANGAGETNSAGDATHIAGTHTAGTPNVGTHNAGNHLNLGRGASTGPLGSKTKQNNVTPIHAARSAGLTEEPVIVEDPEAPPHPTVELIGPVRLRHTRGTEPSRARVQCIEYAAWLLEHPMANAVTMRNSLIVAEGTRRSNMSRLRGWLGSDRQGSPYLPDAYSGRIALHSGVSSDWQRLQLLIVGGVNLSSQNTLIQALEMVRGAPLADAAPGQWHWAEELRTDIASTIRDIGVALAGKALGENNVDLARWATARALTAAPEDELLLCARLRAEHQAGNRVEVERLARRLTQHAKLLDIELNPETVNLLQWVMEGGTRSRTVTA